MSWLLPLILMLAAIWPAMAQEPTYSLQFHDGGKLITVTEYRAGEKMRAITCLADDKRCGSELAQDDSRTRGWNYCFGSGCAKPFQDMVDTARRNTCVGPDACRDFYKPPNEVTYPKVTVP